MTSVVVVDDEALIREGLVSIVSAHAGLDVVGTAGNGAEAIAVVVDSDPDVVLMDVRMPVLDGLEATRRLTTAGVRTKVLILTTLETDEVVFGALRSGASGFLLKSSAPEHLWQGIATIAAGEALVSPAVTRRVIERAIASGPPVTQLELGLTQRQRDVVLGVAHGLSNREIAAELFLSEQTIKGYVSDVLAQLGLHARTQLVIAAYESGLVHPGGTRP